MIWRFVVLAVWLGAGTVFLRAWNPEGVRLRAEPSSLTVVAALPLTSRIPQGISILEQMTNREFAVKEGIPLPAIMGEYRLLRAQIPADLIGAFQAIATHLDIQSTSGRPAANMQSWALIIASFLLGASLGAVRALLVACSLVGLWLGCLAVFLQIDGVGMLTTNLVILGGVVLVGVVLRAFIRRAVALLAMGVVLNAHAELGTLDALLRARSVATQLSQEISDARVKIKSKRQELDGMHRRLGERLKHLEKLETEYTRHMKDSEKMSQGLRYWEQINAEQKSAIEKIIFESFDRRGITPGQRDELKLRSDQFQLSAEKIQQGRPMVERLKAHERHVEKWLATFTGQIQAEKSLLAEISQLERKEQALSQRLQKVQREPGSKDQDVLSATRAQSGLAKEPIGWFREGDRFVYNAPLGSQITPFAPGKVIFADELPKLGAVVMVEPQVGIVHVYQGLKLGEITDGDVVSANKVLGYIVDQEVSLSIKRGGVHFKGEANEKIQMAGSSRSDVGSRGRDDRRLEPNPDNSDRSRSEGQPNNPGPREETGQIPGSGAI